jgi:hypothetical protein
MFPFIRSPLISGDVSSKPWCKKSYTVVVESTGSAWEFMGRGQMCGALAPTGKITNFKYALLEGKCILFIMSASNMLSIYRFSCNF